MWLLYKFHMDFQVGYNGYRGVYALCTNLFYVEITKRIQAVLKYFSDQILFLIYFLLHIKGSVGLSHRHLIACATFILSCTRLGQFTRKNTRGHPYGYSASHGLIHTHHPSFVVTCRYDLTNKNCKESPLYCRRLPTIQHIPPITSLLLYTEMNSLTNILQGIHTVGPYISYG